MSGVNLLVFRGDQRRLCGHKLKAELAEELRLLCGDNSRERSRERLIGALLRAGELECGLADARAEGAHSAELLTDRIAAALLERERGRGCPESDFQNLTPVRLILKTSLFKLCSTLRAIFLQSSSSASPLRKVLPITHFILWLTPMSLSRSVDLKTACWLWASGASAQP